MMASIETAFGVAVCKLFEAARATLFVIDREKGDLVHRLSKSGKGLLSSSSLFILPFNN